MSFLDSVKISQPVSLTGASGKYWRVARNEDNGGEFFVRLRFEDGMMAAPGKDGQAIAGTVLQGNVIYRGPEFDLPEPFTVMAHRHYADDAGNGTAAVLLAKFWAPMGEFYKDLKAMHEYFAANLVEPIQARLQPLFDAAGADSDFSLKQLADMMLAEMLVVERFKAEPVVYINDEYKASQYALKAKTQGKYAAKPSSEPEPESEPDPDEDDDQG